MKKRYSVLTYIVCNYEIVHEIGEKDPEAEYILVTDDPKLKSDTWTVVVDTGLQGSPFDKCFTIRYNSFKYCNTDICIRVDGSVRILHSLKPIIDTFIEGGYDACLMPHPVHDRFKDEYKLWIKIRNYPKSQADRCIASMAERGYDFNYRGLFQECFSIFHKGELASTIDRETFTYIKELGQEGKIERLDQIPWSFIMNTRHSDMKLMLVGEQILRSYYMQWYRHNSDTPQINLNGFGGVEEHYVFNKKESCLYIPTPADPACIREREESLLQEIARQIQIADKFQRRNKRKNKIILYLGIAVAVLITILVLILI